MRYHYGYRITEIIGASAIIFIIMLLIALLSNPIKKLQNAKDEVLADGVRDYMELVLELEHSNPTKFWEIVYQAYNKEIEIGECSDCVDLQAYLEDYSGDLPIDFESGYSREYSGYYFVYENDVLEIGALSPVSNKPIRLMWFVK